MLCLWPIGAVAQYQNEEVGSDIEFPDDLSPHDGRIVNESIQLDGRILVELECDLVNATDGKWRFVKVAVALEDGVDDAVDFGSRQLSFDTLEPNSTTEFDPLEEDYLHVLVEPAYLSTFVARVADNSAFVVEEGLELYQTSVPIAVAINDGDFGIGEDGTSDVFMEFSPTVMRFSIGDSPYKPLWVDDAQLAKDDFGADVLVVSESIESLSSTYTLGGETRTGPAEYFPFLYSGNEEINPQPPYTDFLEVTGSAPSLLELIQYGSIKVDLTRPGSPVVPIDHHTKEGETNDSDASRSGLPLTVDNNSGRLGLEMAPLDPGQPGLTPIPMHFGKLRLSDKVTVSGSFVLKGLPLAVDYRIRPSGNEIDLTMGVYAEVTLLLETEGDVDTTFLAEEEKSVQLLDFDAFQLVVPTPLLKLYVTPNIQFEVGASVRGAAGLSIPLTARIDATVQMGWKDGEFYYDEPEIGTSQPQISSPGTYLEADAEAEVWAEARLTTHLSTDPENLTSNASPSISLRAQGQVGIDPLADDWWTIKGDLLAKAEFELNALGFDLVDAEADLGSWELFDLKSSGGLPAPPESEDDDTAGINPGVRALGDNRARWGRLLNYRAEEGGGSWSFVDLLPVSGTTDILMAGGSGRDIGGVHRLNERGRWISALDFDHPGAISPDGFVAEPDGGFTVMGFSGKGGIQKIDVDGAVVWNSQWDPEGAWTIEAADLVRAESDTDEAEYFVVGHADNGVETADQGYVGKFDKDGELIWSKTYTMGGDPGEANARSFTQATITADGNLLVVGDASKPVAELSGIRCWLVKLDSDDGSVIWQTGVHATRIVSTRDVLEAPDGTIYVAGGQLTVAGDDCGAIVVMKFSGDGELLKTINLQKDSAVEGDYPSGGGTPYDSANAIAWTEDGIWIAGQLNTLSGSTGSGFVSLLDDNLGVLRFAVFGGDNGDGFLDVMPHENGIYVAGPTKSFDPWPESGGIYHYSKQWILSLPFEGLIRFHQRTSAAQPPDGATSPEGAYYLWPQVWNSRAFFETESTISVSDLPLEEDEDARAPEPEETVEVKAIEQVPYEALPRYERYLEFMQFRNGSLREAPDSDGDRMNDALEVFLGTDPDRIDQPNTLKAGLDLETGDVCIIFTRAKFASDALPVIQTSTDLLTWTDRDDWVLESDSFDELLDLVKVSVPVLEGQTSVFIRLAVPEG